MDLNAVYNYFAPMVGSLGGDTFDIMRPDYTQVDNTPVLIQSGVKFRCDPSSSKFAEPRYEGVNFYDIFGPRDILQSGDILVKTVPDGMTPPVTIATFMPIKTLTGFRTARIGKIMDSKGDVSTLAYDNIYFDFLGIGYPGTSINRSLQDSLPVPQQRVVIYNRVNVSRLRSHIIETDLARVAVQPDGSVRPFQRTWIIDEIDQSGPMMVLLVRNK